MPSADAVSPMSLASPTRPPTCTNHHLRNAATHRAMRDAVVAGRIGRVLSARIVHAGTLPIQMLGWRLHTAGAGAGAILDLLVHDADLLRFLLDDEPETIMTVSQNGGLAIAGPARERQTCGDWR